MMVFNSRGHVQTAKNMFSDFMKGVDESQKVRVGGCGAVGVGWSGFGCC